jgi:hypothetical protein
VPRLNPLVGEVGVEFNYSLTESSSEFLSSAGLCGGQNIFILIFKKWVGQLLFSVTFRVNMNMTQFDKILFQSDQALKMPL